jgi:hypothetical protein
LGCGCARTSWRRWRSHQSFTGEAPSRPLAPPQHLSHGRALPTRCPLTCTLLCPSDNARRHWCLHEQHMAANDSVAKGCAGSLRDRTVCPTADRHASHAVPRTPYASTDTAWCCGSAPTFTTRSARK